MKRKLLLLLIVTLTVGSLMNISLGNAASESCSDCYTTTLEEYLGEDFDQLNDTQVENLNHLFNTLTQMEAKETIENISAYEDLLDEFDKTLLDYGIEPYGIEEIEHLKNEIDALYDVLEEIEYKIDTLDAKLETLITSNTFDEDNYLEDGYFEPEEEPDIIKEYPVKNGKIQIDTIDKHQKLWNKITSFLPKKYLKMIAIFEINTDGVDNTMAFVNEEDDTSSTWRLAIDIKDALNENGEFKKEFINTVLHEFAHILTLNNEQMLSDTTETSNTYTIQEGSLKPKAYLNLFYQKFWKEMMPDYHEMIENSEDQAKVDSFYEKYGKNFVTDYAMSNPAEDIAETYFHFILNKRPTGDSIIDKKINFFYQFPELVKQRNYIRTQLNMK